MYLSIGNDMAVREHSVIGIFDLDKCSYGKRTREYLAAAAQEGVVLDISGENYWLVQGAGLVGQFTDQDCSDYAWDYMEADFAAGDYDGAVLSLVDALCQWYDTQFVG